MSLTREEVIHLAELARIHLTDEEIERFSTEFPAILNFVAELGALDTSEIEPMTGGTKSTNILRHDDEGILPIGDPEELKIQFAKTDARGNLVVPRIL